MKLSRTNLVLSVLLLAVVAASLLIQVNHARPNWQIYMGDDMTYSPAYTAYDPNQNFPDGRTLQAPVPGTIARGELPVHFEPTPAGALRAGEKLQNPHQPRSEAASASAQRGANAYRIFCVACHGGSGAGDGPVSRRGFPPPPSLLTGKSVQMKDGQLFHVLTYGQGSMPSFAAQLSPDRRWDLVNYLRTLQPQQAEGAKTDAGAAKEMPPQNATLVDQIPAGRQPDPPAKKAPAPVETPLPPDPITLP